MMKMDEFYASNFTINNFKKLCSLFNYLCFETDKLILSFIPLVKFNEADPKTHIHAIQVRKKEVENVVEVLERYQNLNSTILTPEDRDILGKNYRRAKVSFHNTLASICAYFNSKERDIHLSHALFENSDYIRTVFAYIQTISYELRLSPLEFDTDSQERVYFSLIKSDVIAWQKAMNKMASLLNFDFVITIPKNKINSLR